METWLCVGERVTETWVLTVPMRNGNRITIKYINYIYKVLTVPMRNGNTDSEYPQKLRQQSSYRTYEEWKLLE